MIVIDLYVNYTLSVLHNCFLFGEHLVKFVLNFGYFENLVSAHTKTLSSHVLVLLADTVFAR